MAEETYTLEHAISKDADGNLVLSETPEAATYYLPAGAEIPMEDAIEAGFVTKKAHKAADKQRTPPKNKAS